MPLLTQIIAAVALAVIIIEFVIVFRRRAEQRHWENIQEAGNE